MPMELVTPTSIFDVKQGKSFAWVVFQGLATHSVCKASTKRLNQKPIQQCHQEKKQWPLYRQIWREKGIMWTVGFKRKFEWEDGKIEAGKINYKVLYTLYMLDSRYSWRDHARRPCDIIQKAAKFLLVHQKKAKERVDTEFRRVCACNSNF